MIDGVNFIKLAIVAEISSNRYSHFIASLMRKITSIFAKSRFPDFLNTVCRNSLTYLAYIEIRIL